MSSADGQFDDDNEQKIYHKWPFNYQGLVSAADTHVDSEWPTIKQTALSSST